jgi:ligand-binding SRPBCC domain-containing protein
MTTIHLTTKIKAPIQTVFDASRNIDIHQQSANKTNEIAIAGITSGLINLNETVTWRGKHLGLYLTHKSRITAMSLHDYFVDEMEEEKFKSFKHEHFFEEINGVTIMTDKLQYETPFGILGKLFDFLFLKKHLTFFLLERNKVLKAVSEKKKPIHQLLCFLMNIITNYYTYLKNKRQIHHTIGILSTQKEV